MKRDSNQKKQLEKAEILELQTRSLASIRDLLGFTQSEMALELGISKTALANYEQGKRIMPNETVKLITKKFGANPHESDRAKMWRRADQRSETLNENYCDNDVAIRPEAGAENAVRCLRCKKYEFVTREMCRGGEYLRGQLETRAIEWRDREIAEIAEAQGEMRAKRNKISPVIIAVFVLFILGLVAVQFEIWKAAVPLLLLGVILAGLVSIFVFRPCDAKLRELEEGKDYLTFDDYMARGIYIQDSLDDEIEKTSS